MEYEIVRFGELYEIPSSNGLSRPSAVRGIGFRMINMGELFANDIISDMDMDRVQMSEKEQDKFFVKEDDLLFARQSLVASGAGKCSVIKKISEPTTFESHLIRVRLDKNKANPWFYYYLFKLQNNPIKTIVNQCAQAGIRGNELTRVKVPLVDRELQDKIVYTLKCYDDLIENNSKRIKLLEQMAENLYKEWFVRFRFPGHENAEFDETNPRGWIFGDREITLKPKKWHFGELKELGEFVRGKNITADKMIEGNIAVISAGLSPSGYHNEANVLGKSLTISASGANAGYLMYHLEDIWAADCSYYQNESNIWFVYNSLKFLQPVISNMQAGAAQPHVYPKHVNRISMIIPEKELIEKYCEMVSPIYDEIKILKEKNDNLIKQRDLLLPRLMSGKLEVK